LGRYNLDIDYDNLTDQQLHAENKDSIINGPAEAYLHGNAASMLYKAIKASGENGVRVCITSTKGTYLPIAAFVPTQGRCVY
jgi:hypothetical protein